MSIFTPTRVATLVSFIVTRLVSAERLLPLCMTFANILQGTSLGKWIVVRVNPGPAEQELWRQEQERQKQIRAEAEAQHRRKSYLLMNGIFFIPTSTNSL